MSSLLPPNRPSPPDPECSFPAGAKAGALQLSTPSDLAASWPIPRLSAAASTDALRRAHPAHPPAATGTSHPRGSEGTGPVPHSGTRRPAQRPSAGSAPPSLTARTRPDPRHPALPSIPAPRRTPRSAAPSAAGAASGQLPAWPASRRTARNSSTSAGPWSNPAATGIRASGTRADRCPRASAAPRSCRFRFGGGPR